MGNKNTKLHNAKDEKNDEFYTQLTDIERELVHYKSHFKDKVVFCNCDDPEYSNFWRFFAGRFNQFGLKKLIATHYEESKPSYMLSMERQGRERPPVIKHLESNGDFRSPECIELLKQADIVVTNPPFSLFREYVAQLMEYGKKFVIIGPQNAITYKEIFPLLKDNKMWLGYGFQGGNAYFAVKDGRGYAHGVFDEKTGLVKFRNCCWYTNLDIKKRHEDLILYKHYASEEYPTYDNYNAIEVSKVAEIPCDYDGVMGVPITFMDKYNPQQFEIIDINPHFFSMVEQGLPKLKQLTLKNANKKDPYARILIKRKMNNQ